MSTPEKEKAYRFDVAIAPIWCNTFATIVNQQVGLPKEGRVLVVNCGSGGHSLEIAANLSGQGQVVAIAANDDLLEIGRAKAQVQQLNNISFEFGEPPMLDYDDKSFDTVIADASMMLLSYDIEELANEMLRVTKNGGTVVLQAAIRGSFDEFFSVYWEALHDCGLDEFSTDVEGLITERPALGDAEIMLKHAGLKNLKSTTKKQDFLYENAEQFLTAPIIQDIFFDAWMEILPDNDTARRVRQSIIRIIDRERRGKQFDIAVKATVIWGQKE